jgi:hypothetical protein
MMTTAQNWTTVFRVGEKGFGCVRFPQLHRTADTMYMFVECCECCGRSGLLLLMVLAPG